MKTISIGNNEIRVSQIQFVTDIEYEYHAWINRGIYSFEVGVCNRMFKETESFDVQVDSENEKAREIIEAKRTVIVTAMRNEDN